MDQAELTHIANVASGLDRIVPKIVEAMRLVEHEGDYRRLANLLRPAERFLLESGPVMSRAKPEQGPVRDTCERFMRELPRRLRMVRDAQATLPPMIEQQPILFSRAG